MESRLFYLLSVLFLVFMCGCNTSGAKNFDDLRKIASTGNYNHTKVKVLNNIKYKCSLLTPDLLTILQSNDSILDKEMFDRKKTEYKNFLGFVLIIEDESEAMYRIKKVLSNKSEVNKLQFYANTYLQNDFSLELFKKVANCNLTHLEPTNSIKPSIRIAINFTNVDAYEKGFALVFNDNLFNNGLIKFRFDEEFIENIPHLKSI